MAIQSIRIKNLLSFDELIINDLKDINCIVGQNNVGKSNLLKIIKFFYIRLEEKRELPPSLHSKYSAYGSITIVYNTTRIKKIINSRNNKFFKHIHNTLFKNEHNSNTGSFTSFSDLLNSHRRASSYELTLLVKSDDSTEWVQKDREARKIINFLYPFFDVETRHIDLYDWGKLWGLITKLKSFNTEAIKQDDILDFFDSKISEKGSSYKDYINKIQEITDTADYSYREKVLNYVKIGIKGQSFLIEGKELQVQSDGTNSYKYLEIFLSLLISLTRREYITPTVYIDEPETGLHPKRNEEFILNLHDVYKSFKKTKLEKEPGKYKTPYPTIFFSTHSPNIVKYIIKLFDNNQQILHFSSDKKKSTRINRMNSQYEDTRFLNTFSDNEARLFFSKFILFVEGETELELFGNLKLCAKFPILNKMDVYKTNHMTLKYINPSYSNAAIPFLILNDADFVLSIDIASGKLNISNLKINIDEIIKKINRQHNNGNANQMQKYAKFIMNSKSFPIKIKANKLDYELLSPCLNHDLIIDILNEHILSKANYRINRTTIEGVIINKTSLPFVKKWLFHEIYHNNHIPKETHPKKINSIRMKFNNGKINAATAFSELYSKIKHDFFYHNDHLSRKIKIKYIKEIIAEVESICPSEDDQVILFRLIFEGKTNTLLSRENDKFRTEIPSTYRSELKKLRTETLKPFSYMLGKTQGWVTMFLDFTIESLEKHCDNNDEFRREFSRLFPELYGIIKTVSSSIE